MRAPLPGFICLICFVSLLFSATGCATTKVVAEYDCADAVSVNRDTTVWHFLWGLVQAKDIRPQCDARYNHLNKVESKTTPLQVIVSFVTLGIALPQKVSWCCAPYNPTPGVLGQPRTP